MKHFDTGRLTGIRALAVWLPVALIVPNVALSFTEDVSVLSALCNVLLPLGVYMLLTAAWKRTGATALCMIPVMALCGFQIVLLYLYGGSVIAVDMFLNVVTTNVSEATELLASLVMAMAVVIFLYLVPIVWGIVALIRKQTCDVGFRRRMARTGAAAAVAGIVCLVLAEIFVPYYSFEHQTFPVNAVSNLIEACRRYHEVADHDEAARSFTYHARSMRDSTEREIYIFVVGETARGLNWQLGGYERPTNPRLSAEKGAVFFPNSISESNTTHKSVPMLISHLSAENFDSLVCSKSIITAFREAGYHTAFISNQEPNRSFTEHFGNEADEVNYVYSLPDGHHACDEALLPEVDRLLADTLHRKQFIVLHTYGSHFKYRDRYPDSFSHFTPDNPADASRGNRDELINAYDNTIRYTDFILASLIDRLRNTGARTALVYSSDHGEDIFDDARERFLHASPAPTYWQIHQAALVWLSDTLIDESPGMARSLRRNASRRISPQKSLFPTAMQIAGIESPMVVDSLSLVSASYSPAPAVYLNDLNEALPLERCGLKSADLKMLSAHMK